MAVEGWPLDRPGSKSSACLAGVHAGESNRSLPNTKAAGSGERMFVFCQVDVGTTDFCGGDRRGVADLVGRLVCPGVGRLSGWVCCFLGQMEEVCLVSSPCPKWAPIGPVGKNNQAGGRQKFDGSS